MGITSDLWIAALYGGILVLAALGQYLNRPKASKTDSVLTGVAGGLVDRDQMAQLIHQVTRIADAISDKNTAGINERLEDLAEQLDRAMKPAPPRRR